MKFCYRDDILDWRLVMLMIVLFFAHILAIKIGTVGSVLFILENMILVYTLIKRRLDWFLYVLSIVLPVTFDIPSFVNNSLTSIFSVIYLPIVQGYFFIALILLFLPMIFNLNKWKILLHTNYYKYFVYFALMSFVFGIIIGVITICYEDVNVSFRISMWTKQIIGVGMFSLYMLLYLFEYAFNPQFRSNLKVIVFSSLVAVIFASFISVMIGFKGSYGDNEIILAPLAFFFSTSILVFLFYKQYASKHKLLIFVLSLLSLFMQFQYANALGGKSWLVIIVLFPFFIYKVYKFNKTFFVFFCLILPITLSALFFSLIESKLYSSDSSSGKLVQVVMLISAFGGTISYDDIPTSPKTRFEEFFNTIEDYSRNPQFMFLGKGFGGGHKDFRNAYGYYDPGKFSVEQYNNKYFVFTHESINGIFLRHGLLGLLLFLLIICLCTRYFNNSPWLIIGGLWFAFFWGYSLSLMSIGLPSLLIGVDSIQKRKH